tara:strand:+ start:315 stop:593 length:279 start_codon:yes stop_codon:yes gene_type:complete
MNTIPNLDALDSADLLSYARRYEVKGLPRAAAALLIGDRRKGYTLIARNVGHYARNAHVARECRIRGDIQAAQNYENICENIYARLPADLRW